MTREIYEGSDLHDMPLQQLRAEGHAVAHAHLGQCARFENHQRRAWRIMRGKRAGGARCGGVAFHGCTAEHTRDVVA